MFAKVNPIFTTILNELLDIALQETSPATAKVPFVKPGANIIEKENGYIIQLAVPGLQKEDIKLNLEKNVLTITAEKEVPTIKGAKFNIKEFEYARFKRTFVLPDSIDVQNIGANYTNGILTVTLVKTVTAKPTVTQIMVA